MDGEGIGTDEEATAVLWGERDWGPMVEKNLDRSEEQHNW